ncbi:MAG: hypothetical protein D3910_00560, partial [Candidatus Electrothrix sp. ATG2]|nr:hypothetical protein [Candidatus Electrothrix sp. ATG2]
MSEFSESYHLWSNSIDEGKSLLNKSGQSGFIFPAVNNWITLLPEGDIFVPNKNIIKYNQGILLHYAYAEDHEWSLGIYKQNTLVSFYHCDWNQYPNIIINDDKFDFAIFKEIMSTDAYSYLEKNNKSILYPES